MSAAHETFQAVAREVLTEVLGRNGVSLKDVEQVHAASTSDLTGIIFFSGAELRGTLVLGSKSGVIAGSCPAYVRDAQGDSAYPDWICELSNQVLGGIQRKLAERGVAIEIGTPISVNGSVLKPQTRPMRGHTEQGEVVLRIDLTAPSDFAIPEAGTAVSLATVDDVELF